MPVTDTKRKNRSRKRAKKTTGRIRETAQDVGFCDPLDRYFELPSNILGEFYNLYNGNDPESTEYLNRLTRLFQEAEDYTSSRKLLDRPDYQDSYDLNNPAIYRKTLGTTMHLKRFGARDDLTIQWSTNTQIAHIDESLHEARPDDHDKELIVICSSIELEARKDKGFINHLEILRHASKEAQTAEEPLAMPVRDLTHRFPSGATAHIANTSMEPDFLFGLPVQGGAKFYSIERDRGTEVMEPSKSLTRKSWLKNILMMNALQQSGGYQAYFNIPNLQIIAIFDGYTREQTFHRLVRQYARFPNQYLSTVVPRFNAIAQPYIIRDLYTRPLNRVDGSTYTLKEGR